MLDLNDHLDQSVRVKFAGGREVTGILKGYDQLLNVVLDECTEYLRSPNDLYKLSGETRNVGLVVARGTSIICLSKEDGATIIPNPFT